MIYWASVALNRGEKKMSNLTLQLDSDALREATVQAIIGVLTPEVKANVLENAVQAILKPSTNSWEKNKSPLELAFERAVEQVANAEAKRMIEEDGAIRERIKELLRATADKVLNADPDKLAQRMANAFADSMRRN
jgi:glycosyltransferase A (GT-A) superfamily protein (DUF2064 family)